jgi:hypothetical protein
MPADRTELSRVNLPTPAIVAERGVERLPRLALLLLCAAYLLPGIFGRAPWRNADLTAFGFMASIADGRAPWWQPAIAGIPAEGGPLPYWLGALAIKVLPFLDAPVAARRPRNRWRSPSAARRRRWTMRARWRMARCWR